MEFVLTEERKVMDIADLLNSYESSDKIGGVIKVVIGSPNDPVYHIGWIRKKTMNRLCDFYNIGRVNVTKTYILRNGRHTEVHKNGEINSVNVSLGSRRDDNNEYFFAHLDSDESNTWRHWAKAFEKSTETVTVEFL